MIHVSRILTIVAALAAVAACRSLPRDLATPVADAPLLADIQAHAPASRPVEAVYRALLTRKGDSQDMVLYLSARPGDGFRVAATTSLGNSLFEVHASANAEHQVCRSMGALPDKWLREAFCRDVQLLLAPPVPSRGAYVERGGDRLVLVEPVNRRRHDEYVFDSDTFAAENYARVEAGLRGPRCVYRVDYDGMGDAYPPPRVEITDRQRRYSLTFVLVETLDMNKTGSGDEK